MMRASSRLSELDPAGAWIEAANGSRDDRVELLHDDEPFVRSLHEPFALGDLVTGVLKAVSPAGTDLVVLVECRGTALGALGISTFADELGIVCVEPVYPFGDSLFDYSEQRLRG